MLTLVGRRDCIIVYAVVVVVVVYLSKLHKNGVVGLLFYFLFFSSFNQADDLHP